MADPIVSGESWASIRAKLNETNTEVDTKVETGSDAALGDVTVDSLEADGLDGESRVGLVNNTTYAPAVGEYSIFFEGGVLKKATNGAKSIISAAAPEDTTDPVVALGPSATHDGTGKQFEITSAMVVEENLSSVIFNFDGGGNTSITLPYTVTVPANTASHTLTVVATDGAGNTGTGTKVFTYDADSTNPVVDLGPDTTHYGAGTNFDITTGMVTEENIDFITYQWDSGTVNTISLPYTVTTPLDTSDHTLTVSCEDTTGNTGSDSKLFSYTAPSSYLISQNFEGVGYDNGETWTETSTPDPNYTAAPLRGSDSLKLSGVTESQAVEKGFAAQSDVWIAFRMKMETIPDELVSFFSMTASAAASMDLRSLADGTLNLLYKKSGGNESAPAGTIVAGTTYFMWIHFQKATTGGTDGQIRIYLSTSRALPGSPLITRTTDVDFDGAVDKIKFTSGGYNTGEIVLDQIIVSDSAIGDMDA